MCDQLRTPEYDKWCIEQARAYMEHIHGLRLRIDALQYQIDDARNNMLPGGVRYDKGTNGTTSPDDKLVDGLTGVQRLICSYTELLDDYVGEVCQATQAIHSLHSGEYVKMLTAYYLCGHTWAETARIVNYSEQHVYRLLDCALLELYDVMPHTWRAPKHQAL